MRHRSWISALTIVLTVTIGAFVMGQSPVPFSYGTLSAGPSVAQASYDSGGCGACQGSGCGICGVASSSSACGGCGACTGCSAPPRSACGCGSGSCGGGCLSGGGLGGGGLGGGAAFQHLQALGSSHYGGYATQQHGQENGPFGGAGCCTPIWYDFHVEWMALERENVGDTVNLASRNAGGPIALSTDDLDFDVGHGFRATYAMLFGPSTNVEASYFGTHDWDSAASVNGNADLYSVFSEFGTSPIDTSVNPPRIGFPETVDMANSASINYESELHNVEINLRKRWVSANCLLHGSYLAGVRYVSLNEDFSHDVVANSGGFMNYDVNTQNDAFGFQLGGDTFVCMSPRFKLGVEAEAGIYGNDTKANTNVVWQEVNVAPSPIQRLNESESDTDVALVAELGAIGLFRLTPRMTIRGGYQLLYLDGVALAAENFNVASPFSARQAFVDNNGDVFYHGATLGCTFTW